MIIKNENLGNLIWVKSRKILLCIIVVIVILILTLLYAPKSFLDKKSRKLLHLFYPEIVYENSTLSGLVLNFKDYFNYPFIKKMIYLHFGDVPTVKMHINFVDYEHLRYIVAEIKKRNDVINEAEKAIEVPAIMEFGKEKIKVKLHLKGLYLDHLIGNKWSFKVNTKGNDHFMGMNTFSLQNPITRNYLYEWTYQLINKKIGVISLNFDFLKFYLNGEYLGVYAVEEFFDTYLIEHNRKRDGLIAKLQGEYVQALKPNSLLKDPKKKRAHQDLSVKYYAYLKGDLNPENFFDYVQTAKYFALSGLFAGGHGQLLDNFVVYLNPITNLLEPIPFDGNVGRELNKNTESGLYIENIGHYNIYHSPFLVPLFRQKKFFDLFIKYLKQYSDENFILNFKSEIQDARSFYMDMLYMNDELNRFKLNQDTITGGNLLINSKYIEDFLKINIGQNSKPFFDKFVETLKSITYSKSSLDLQKTNLQNEFKLPKDFEKHEYYKDLLLNLSGKIQHLNDYFNIDYIHKTLTLKKSLTVINHTLVIPEGFEVLIPAGSTIDLKKGASFISWSPLAAIGNKNHPITIYSKDKTGGGFFVLNTDKKSEFSYCVFNSLSAPEKHGWSLTGAVTFYQADVDFLNCTFENNLKSDDALNIVRSDFTVTNSLFNQTFADALDLDFSNGLIANSHFINLGNDAIDGSGSKLDIVDVIVQHANDKALSCGEESICNANKIDIVDSNIGIASKDGSRANINNVHIHNTQYGLVAFNKKSQFKPPQINAEALELQSVNIPYTFEKKSTIKLNGEILSETKYLIDHAREKFYGK